jgi:hypothetical protein
MAPNELAKTLGISGKTLRGWLRRTFPRPDNQKGSAWVLPAEHVSAALRQWSTGSSSKVVGATADFKPRNTSRADSDEAYVINLCDDILGERASRQHRFPWLCGDPCSDGTGRCLPVDAYYQRHRLVVEYRERQHSEPVAFFDKRQTVSGVGRGEQRRIYDRRREQEIPKHGLHLLVIHVGDLEATARGRLRRNVEHDRRVLKPLLEGVVARRE